MAYPNIIIPDGLKDSNLFSTLQKLTEFLDTDSQFTDRLQSPYNGSHAQALVEFLDVLKYVGTRADRDYVISRLSALKSTKRVLDELDQYLPIKFDRTLGVDGLPNTRYSPKLLKVTFKYLEVEALTYDFISIIDRVFESLLYFLDYEMNIDNLVIKLQADLEKEFIVVDYTPVSRTYFNTNYLL